MKVEIEITEDDSGQITMACRAPMQMMSDAEAKYAVAFAEFYKEALPKIVEKLGGKHLGMSRNEMVMFRSNDKPEQS